MENGDRFSDEPISGIPDDDVTPATKRLKPPGDRLSELPDLALVHILSYLYVEEAARTSIMSKRFNSLWKSVDSLNFSDENSGKNGELFITFVDAALGFHHRREIEKFSVKFCYALTYDKVMDGWIQFAVQKQVKSLHLDLIQNHGDRVVYEHELPKFLYRNEKLVELVISCCKFSTNWEISWNSLRLLCITRTKVNEELISRILSGCPVLETLELRDWSGFDRLKINSVSLRVLRIIGEQKPRLQPQPQPEDERLLEISGPNLASLEVSGSLYRTKVRVNDVGSLVSATMDFEIKPVRISKYFWIGGRDQDIVREVLESLWFVKALTVGEWCIKALSTFDKYNLSSPWSKRKSLTVCIPLTKWDHLGMASLLSSSPYLETLVIRLSHCSDVCGLIHSHESFNKRDDEYYWKSWSIISKCPLVHLKTVKVMGFRASCGTTKPIFQFLEFCLGNSRVLEEVVIQASHYVGRETLVQAIKLVSVPTTASPDAVVLFEPPHFWVDPHYMCPILNSKLKLM